MKIIIIPLFLLAGCSLKFTDSTNIVNNQTDIALKISNHEEFDIDQAINDLRNEAVLNVAKGINPVSNNNIAIRNHLILAMLYYMKNDEANYNNERDTALIKINYNLIDDSIYSEGPGYYLYIEEILNVYNGLIGRDKELDDFRNKCNSWYSKYIMPDGTLPPIGDTRRYKYKFVFDTQNRVVYDSEETLFKIDDITLFFRHSSKIDKYKLNSHVHYDIGDFCLYKNDKCIVLPLGYPGSKKKNEYGLESLKYKNSIYVEDLGCWRFKNYEKRKVERTENTIYIEYKINSKITSRKLTIEKDKIIIEDFGSDGININIADCDINVLEGNDVEYYKGFHCENLEDVVENNIAFIKNRFGITKIELILK